jgi:hypothetical protein
MAEESNSKIELILQHSSITSMQWKEQTRGKGLSRTMKSLKKIKLAHTKPQGRKQNFAKAPTCMHIKAVLHLMPSPH